MQLWRLLDGGTEHDADGGVPVYASGINPEGAERLVGTKLDEGYRAFKLKVGFGEESDQRSLRGLRALLGSETALMVDANQGWTVEQALAVLPLLRPFDLDWLEDPLAVDAPAADWARLAEAFPIPLAAGENLRGEAAFDAAIDGGALSVVQPRSEEHTSELQSLMRISYAVFCLKKKKKNAKITQSIITRHNRVSSQSRNITK